MKVEMLLLEKMVHELAEWIKILESMVNEIFSNDIIMAKEAYKQIDTI